ncbi:60S acidic ribosomal protein P2-like [Penaeus japonicus]|uniref:60S acidic ribosomal protein P2-like n=1 Tax=Penaeus japonicus TaxID=27405 RepID=UPI001C70E779|nr:60S acidic ribosomal protein P2-like [Penaeus japonicus]
MRHVCAYLLAAMGSNAANAANMKAILASVGVEADDKQLEIVIQKFGGKNIDKVIAEGSAYLAAMGGGGGAVAASSGAPAGGAADAPKAEEKKEEKVESEESDDDMGFGLFD